MTDDLDELLRLHGEATGGEWQVEEVSRHYADCQIYAPSLGPCRVIGPIASAAARDARFIAAAHNALPGLVERVRRAEAERDIWKAAAVLASDKLTTTIAERDALREVAGAARVVIHESKSGGGHLRLPIEIARLGAALRKVPT